MSISLRELTGVFLRLGNLTFGGGDPTLAGFYRELVERRHALSAPAYALCYGLARLTPGTNVLAFCAGAGWILRGWRGALLCVVAASLPAGLVAVWLSWGYEAGQGNTRMMTAFSAMTAAVAGMMAASALRLVRRQWREAGRVAPVLLVAGAFLLSWRGWMSPVTIVGLAALAGLVWPAKEPA